MRQKTGLFVILLCLYLCISGIFTILYSKDTLNNKIIASGDCAYPPFEFINQNGEADGFNIEIFKALMEHLNLEYEINLTNWSDALNALKDKKVDVISGLAHSKLREELFLFSTPHSYLYLNIVCRKGSSINSLDDLRGRDIILQNNTLSYDIITQLGITDIIIPVDNMSDGLQMLSTGKHDAAICSDIAAKNIIINSKLKNLELRLLPTVKPINSCFAFHSSNKELQELFNKGIGHLKANGTYNKIYNKWFSAYQEPVVSKYVYIVIAILTIVLLISFIVIYIIRKHINNVTSKLHKINEELTESLLKIKLALKTNKLIQWDYDCNTEVFKTINYTLASTLTIENYSKLIHPSDIAKVEPIFNQMRLRNDSDYSFEMRMRRSPEQEWQYMSVDASPIKDKDEQVIKYTGVLHNNTKFVKLNEQLEERNAHIGMALQAGYIIPAIIDTETDMVNITSVSMDGDKDMINMSSSVVSMQKLIDGMHPNDREKMVRMFSDIKNGVIKKGHEEICYNYLGNENDFEANYLGINFNKNGRPSKIVGYFQNITERKKSEILLKKQQELMSNILNLIPIPIHIKDVEDNGKYIYRNHESEKMLGASNNKYTHDLLTKENAQEIFEIDKKVFETQIPYIGQECLKTLDGREYETIVHKNVIYNGDKKQLLVVRWDISYQNELYRKSKILSISMNALKAFTWYCDLRDNILRLGDGFEHTGASPDQINSIFKFAQKIHPNYRQSFLDFMDNFCKQDSGDFAIEYEIDLSGDGNYEWWECRGAIEIQKHDNTSYKCIYGMDINIDKLKKNELDILKNKAELDRLNIQNELILNNTDSGLVYIDNDYIVQWENLSSFLPNHPITQYYHKGSVCYNIVKELNEPCHNCVVKESHHSLKRETKTIELDGLTAELTASPVVDSNNNRVGTVLKIVDITEKNNINLELKTAKNKAEAAKNLMSNIFDRLPCLLFIKDVTDDFRYIIANNYFCNVLGKPNSEVVGKTDFEIFGHEEAAKFRADDLIAVNEKSPFVFEEETWWQGKHVVWQTTKSLIEAINGHQIMIAISLDITEKIDAYNQLQDAKEKAEQSNKLKSAFLANMSHEIRTPLNAIVGFSELISYTHDEEEKMEYSKIISTNNELLLRLIGDILDLSKIEAGMMELRPERFNVSELFKSLESSLSQRVTSKDVKFICEIPYECFMVELDKNRFTQVITNFATNAIKFTPIGEIRIGYEYVNGGIKVYVSDTGIGIAANKIEKVFERFEKLDDFAQGTGLGMAICKAIMDSSGGDIGLESEVGKGSTFWAWFPTEVNH